MNGSAGGAPLVNGHSGLDSVLNPPTEQVQTTQTERARGSPDNNDNRSTTLQ
jgi:hypothetical protein